MSLGQYRYNLTETSLIYTYDISMKILYKLRTRVIVHVTPNILVRSEKTELEREKRRGRGGREREGGRE